MRKLFVFLTLNLALLFLPALAQASSVPAYRMYDSHNGDYLTTDNENEAVTNSCPSPGYVLEHSDYFNTDTGGGATTVERLYNPKTGDHVWSLSNIDISNALGAGYHEETADAFLAYTTLQSGGVTMYRVYNPKTGLHFYTTNSTEATNAAAAGFSQNEGAVFYFSSSASQHVDRLYNPTTGDHFYTANPSESNDIDCLNPQYSETYTTYNVQTDNSTGAAPVYRLVSPRGKHFLTVSASERDSAIAAGFTSEGTAFYAFTSSTGGHVPVYRAYNMMGYDSVASADRSGDYFYTIDQNEYTSAIAHGYSGEGIAFYVDSTSPQSPY